jgi:signal transduction histidine kinase
LAAAAVALFVVDEVLPLGFSAGIFYVPLIAAAALYCTSRTAIGLAVFFLVLMTIELLTGVSSQPEVRQLAIVNRGLAMAMVAVMAVVMIRYRHVRSELSAAQQRRVETAEEVQRLNAELEARVERRTEQLAAVNKELEAFTYSVSHDLRAPLRGMSGFARVLEEDYADKLDDDGRRYLQIIKSNAAQMGQLIDDLLALSRLGRQPLKATTISLEALANEGIRQAASEAGNRQIEFTVDSLPPARGDVSLVRQVLVNLLSNAVKFTRHVSGARIHVGSQTQNGEVAYFVRDNGAGFDMRYVGKLFGVFQRLHGPEDYAGTGVGLAIVKRIIDRHGGRVWAEGAPGKGASFYFTLGQGDGDVG